MSDSSLVSGRKRRGVNTAPSRIYTPYRLYRDAAAPRRQRRVLVSVLFASRFSAFLALARRRRQLSIAALTGVALFDASPSHPAASGPIGCSLSRVPVAGDQACSPQIANTRVGGALMHRGQNMSNPDVLAGCAEVSRRCFTLYQKLVC